MNISKVIKKSLLVIGVCCLCMANASAALTFFITDAKLAGEFDIGGNKLVVIQATDQGGAFTNQFFTISSVIEKAGLAATLAAIALNKPLFIQVDLNVVDPVGGFPLVKAVFVSTN